MLASGWLDVAGKDVRASSVVLGFIVLSPISVLSPLPWRGSVPPACDQAVAVIPLLNWVLN